MTSEPTTNALQANPLAMNCDPTISPYMNPEQAALRSKAGAMQPSFRCKMHAVDGVM
jgi:hypothetical protein